MKITIIYCYILIGVAVSISSCKKEKYAAQIEGTYVGLYNSSYGSYSAPPFGDTTYESSVTVTYNKKKDSVYFDAPQLGRTGFKVNYSNEYEIQQTVNYKTFTFVAPDSLFFNANHSGSGGYSRWSFKGKR